MSGSAAIRFRNRRIAATPSSMPSSMQTSRMFAPPSTCWRATATASSYLSSLISRRNTARAGDVRALADHDEVRLRRDRQRLETGEPRVARGLRHRARRDAVDGLRDRGDVLGPRAAAAADEVQHALAREAAEHLRHVLGRVVVAAELVRQAGVRIARDRMPAIRASSATCGRMSSAPSAQLMLTANRFACATELKNASTVWPDSVRPERSGIVTDAITGTRAQRPARTARSIANSAALQFSVSMCVSVSSRSTPPSSSAAACSRYASTSWRNVTERAPGIVDVGRQRGGLRRRADRAGDPARLAVLALGALRGAAGDLRGREVDVARRRASRP